MRDKLIVYGTCQAASLFDVLNCLPALTARYSIHLHFVGDQSTHWRAWKDDLRAAALLVFQDCAGWPTYPIHQMAEPDQPPRLEFPGLSLRSLWPFDAAFSGPDPVAEQLNPGRTSGLHYFDGLHARLRPYAEPAPRYEIYRNLGDIGQPDLIKFYRRFDIDRLFELEAYRLQKLDERLGSHIGRYILTNFNHRRLFHTAEHPTVELTYRVAQEIAHKLSIEASVGARLQETQHYYQVPIHPKVAAKLNLSWVRPDATYRVYNHHYSFEHYHRKYIRDYG